VDRRERARTAVTIALSTFGILALELALIRWMSQQVRMFAYLNNILLMTSFLGMGLGFGIGRRRPGLIHATLPLLALLSGLLTFSRELGLMRLTLRDPSILMWGDDPHAAFFTTVFKLLLLMTLVVVVFVCAASLLGSVFGRYGDTLGAYSWDLIGSLAGILAMTALAALQTSPPWWLAVGALPFLWLSRRWTTVLSFLVVVALAASSIRGAQFSPYNRLDVTRDSQEALTPKVLAANRDAHQYLLDLSANALATPGLTDKQQKSLRDRDYMYRLPFTLPTHRRSALIVGAGTGNDVAAALRSGFTRVVAVEIDPVIYRIGLEEHPEKPYDDPRVEVVISDARTFFERTDEKFDVICFGLLDSHAMFSAMSSLRLDNYVYTEEAMRAAYAHLTEPGVMSVSFSVAGGPWIAQRITRILHASTGVAPSVINFVSVFYSRTWLVGKGLDVPALASNLSFADPVRPIPDQPRVTTDDWPFLYLRPDTFPSGLVTVLVSLLVVAAAGARVVFGESFFSWRRFNGPFFFMGAAFLLIETRGVTNLSLLFGSTWIVNSAVFAGILLAALAANVLVRRITIRGLTPLFVLLAGTLAVNYVVPPGAFLGFSPGTGGVLAALVNGVPVGIAGVIFSSLLAKAPDPAAALGWNLLGAVLGGSLEYLSMVLGLRALILIALALYALTFMVTRGRSPGTASAVQ